MRTHLVKKFFIFYYNIYYEYIVNNYYYSYIILFKNFIINIKKIYKLSLNFLNYLNNKNIKINAIFDISIALLKNKNLLSNKFCFNYKD